MYQTTLKKTALSTLWRKKVLSLVVVEANRNRTAFSRLSMSCYRTAIPIDFCSYKYLILNGYKNGLIQVLIIIVIFLETLDELLYLLRFTIICIWLCCDGKCFG